MDSRYLLFLTRTSRGFIYGVFSVVTVVYLIDSGLIPLAAGFTVTLSIIVGSLVNFFITTRYGSGYSRIFLLIFSVLLFTGITGIFFSPYPWLKALFAVVGSLGVNPSDNTLFSSYEQPVISRIKEDQHQKNILFSLYAFGGYSAAAIGAFILTFGLAIAMELSMVLAVLIFFAYLLIPTIEGKKAIKLNPPTPKSKLIARDVATLFSMDALGGGFVVQSLIAYWFYFRYSFSIGQLGIVFTVVDVIMGISVLITPFIASRIGLVNTIVFTHLPSNVFLMLIPVIPNLYASLLFLFLRQSLSQMDVPTRQSYLNSIVTEEDRSYVVGITNSTRSLANGSTPYISSYLISIAAGASAFIGGGAIKIAYDLLFYQRFKKEREHYD